MKGKILLIALFVGAHLYSEEVLKIVEPKNGDNIKIVNIGGEKTECYQKKDSSPILAWFFGGTDIGAGTIIDTKNNTPISFVSASVGFRYNFRKNAPAFVSDPGLSLSARLGGAFLAYNSFKQKGYGIPVEVEFSYLLQGGLLFGVGVNYMFVPELGAYKNVGLAEAYGEIGFAHYSGGALRVGYVFYGNGNMGQTKNVDFAQGAITASLRFKL